MKQYTKEIAATLAKRLGEVKISDMREENGIFEVIATSEDVDRHGEIIRIDGWDIANYLKNPIILFGHDYNELDNVVGRATDIRFDGTKMIVCGMFASADANPKAQQLRKLYDEGIIKTVSVGFIPLERDPHDASAITRAELLELSFVPIPANPKALDIMRRCGADPGVFGESPPETADIRETLSGIVRTLETLARDMTSVKKLLVDGETRSDAEKEQKEHLRTAARAVNEALRDFGKRRA